MQKLYRCLLGLLLLAVSTIDAADLNTELDALRTIRGESYVKARTALLAKADVKDFLVQYLKAHPGDWQAFSLLTRLAHPDLAQAADNWNPKDPFQDGTTGLETDLIQMTALDKLQWRVYEWPQPFGPAASDDKFDLPASVALVFECLARDTVKLTPAYRAWMWYFTLVHLPLADDEISRGRPYLPNKKIDAAQLAAWAEALLLPGEDPITRLFAAGRSSSPAAEKELLAVSAQDVPLAGLAALWYGAKLPNALFSLSGPRIHGAWLENWSSQLKPNAKAITFLEALFVIPPVHDPFAEGATHYLDWSAYSCDQLLSTNYFAAGVIASKNPKQFSQKFQTAYLRALGMEIGMTLGQFDSMPPEAQPPGPVLEQVKAKFRFLGKHLPPEAAAAFATTKFKSDTGKALATALQEGAKEYTSQFITGKELDGLVTAMKKMQTEMEKAARTDDKP